MPCPPRRLIERARRAEAPAEPAAPRRYLAVRHELGLYTAALDAFLARVTALGQVGQHNKTAEDRTDEVVDTEARLKNMSEFRDQLRRLMATPKAKLAKLIEVERELTRVQSEIDRLASRRKALAGLTDKVHVRLSIQARPSVLETGMWSPVRDAVLRAGHVRADSVATLIHVVVAALPRALGLGGGRWHGAAAAHSASPGTRG
ncbi:DUF4349 domain-containing protein [Aquabacterium sp. A7-Y]|uniref:DUF4349 domain-containing protein n=1 Tax=Aquabacterium sp. A7-Y TaxID=1349605 RepID=UPI00223E539B|nr:DUF4349 domain-containing protein [Aquabacterium sp. A7-Y]MCW7538303.1 DUF4349 domain-containing protein [Aquabacterium sp. A7-Y]